MLNYDLLTFMCFVLLGVLLYGYAVLDGFDLGVGVLHPWVGRSDTERRLVMNSIGPLWDGNEVWLVTFGGALFAAFPNAYATVLSGFYFLFYFLLLCLIGRAVSIEFRSKVTSGRWRWIWDKVFFASSFFAAAVLGVAAGNVIGGMELDPRGNVTGGPIEQLTQQLRWYPLLVGCLTVALFALHGAIYLYLKTEDDLQQRVRRAITPLFLVFASLYVVVTLATWWQVPHAVENLNEHPWLWIVPALNVLAVLNIPRAMHLGRPGYAFFSSAMVILALASLFSVAIYPYLVISSGDPELSISLANARSSQQTLANILVIAGCGMPFVLAYTVVVYWIFHGKVTLDPSSY